MGRTAIVGIVDVLQFWTPAKRIAHRFKRSVGMERDGGRDCCGEIIDTVWPSHYGRRFLRFLREMFTQGSWVDSLRRMAGGDWSCVLVIQIEQLPEPQRRLAQAEQFRAEEIRRARMSWWVQPDSPRSHIGLEDDSPHSPFSPVSPLSRDGRSHCRVRLQPSRCSVQTLSSFLDADNDGSSWCSPLSSLNSQIEGAEVSVGTLADFLSV